ncbi:DEHYDRATION-INDUCED 19 isoform 1 [Dorcoceras hygrometricum]|uniref:DEHYDRATION-INDUCED 19 isoform 1 n=1 Tax=Dorcoceras hygrometricum TaxID=472368 RepID=A0A2Z7ARI5_9LAMI|nr:DEHYDRATION-INDUCED 19 isoform 1 [Dorcoceras hygrometricum]
MKRRRAGESADGLALMMSSVTSSYSADGLSLAVARISRCYLEIAIAKRCLLHKLIRQHFALALKDSAGRLCVDNQSQDTVASFAYPVASSTHPVASFGIQTQEKKKQAKCRESTSRELQYPVAGNPGAKNRRSSKAQQLKNESAAKQLTTYEELSKLDVNC